MAILDFCEGGFAGIEMTCQKEDVQVNQENRKNKQGERF
jgi:hypothetical protein